MIMTYCARCSARVPSASRIQGRRNTMHEKILFKAELYNGRIVLSGDMDRAPTVRQECERVAKLAAQTGSQFVVDAQNATLWVGGENAWAEVAQEFLGRCQLIYLPSPLA